MYITDRQKEILCFLVQYTFEHLYQPTIREMCERFNLTSTNGMAEHLRALEHKGYITVTKHSSRAIHIHESALYFVENTERLRARPILPVRTVGSSECLVK